ncbi:Lon protease family protein [Salidesulfovibrio brasiliensis]|uniref:Lon protease family protein n=1 Tax=Salidesulfovibrio brasiliensis TaxID=221711 RepID=UPI0006CF7EF1|nr:ATP-binding protein [Salidesulfovibrio brasiliensis]
MSRTRTPRPLPVSRLRAALDPEKIPFETSDEIPDRDPTPSFQPRAMKALELALAVKGNEYNVYVAGEPNMGRTHFVKTFLGKRAKKAPTPADWVYLYNFEDEDRPVAVSLPAGMGRKFKNAQQKAVSRLKSEVPARFDEESFQKKHERLLKKFSQRRDELFARMEEEAEKAGFRLTIDEDSVITLAPLVDGKPLQDSDYDTLDSKVRKKLKEQGEVLLDKLSGDLRSINQNEQVLKKNEDDLHRETARAVLRECMAPVREQFDAVKGLPDYFDALEDCVVENVDQFQSREVPSHPLFMDSSGGGEDFFTRFEVNLFVDNGRSKGAPVILEDHPTAFNLLGSIERETEMGALYTDFTLVKAGALQKANGGFLIINVEDLLTNPHSWEGLLRALRAGNARIEDPVEPDQVRARTIEPQPIPIELRVILIGTDVNYELMLYNDDRFAKYFKVKAHLQSTCKRDAAHVKRYLQAIGRVARQDESLPLSRGTLAGLVDFGSRLAEDQKRLSLYFPLLRERVVEASAMARLRGAERVEADDLARSLDDRDYRSNLYEAEFMSDYDREVIKVATGGTAVGEANGLSVTQFGDHEFGLPHRIACRVGVGHGGIIDLEREAQLGGPIHTKGMMIIKSYLVGLFAQNKPIVMTGSLCFEQSYAGIEGDSASGAELASLLSALSGAPIDLSYAFTGAVSQSGCIMAVGGVNEKVEGFHKVCKRRGLTGKQGVLLPADNVVNLMLRDDVVRDVEAGLFAIYPVSTIEQAMRILTGVPTGTLGKNGTYPAGTLFRMVDDRLAELAELARKKSK